MEKNKLKILSIDDHLDNLISLKALIREAFPDAIPLMAENGPAGINLALSEDPDMILLDVVMPGMDGFEVCQKLKLDPKTSDIPVVFITAVKGDKQSRIRALEVGAEAFLAKPIDETELTAQIRAMVKIKVANNQKRWEKEVLAELVTERTRELEEAHDTTLKLLEELRKENEARKKNEVDLHKAKKFLEEAQRISHLGNWEWDLTSNQSTWSREMYQIYGRDQEMGTPPIDNWMDNIFPDDRTPLQNAIQSAMSTGTYRIDYRILRYDNAQIRWMHAEGEVTFEDGKPVSLHGVAQDITEHKQAEETLQLSEEKYRLLHESAGVGIGYYSPEGVVFSYNAIAAEHMGGKPEDFSGKSIYELYPRPAADVYMERIHKAIASEKREEYEDKVDLPGEAKWFVSAFSRILDTSNQVRGVQIISTDISQVKQTEEALRKSEAELRAVLDATPFPIALVDVEDNQIDYWSQSALSIFGHTAPTTGAWYQIAYPDAGYRNEVIGRWKPALEKAYASQQSINTGEYRVSCKDGSVRICELYASFLRDKLIVTFNDITERKLAEEALRENQMMLANILDSVPQNIFWKDLAGVYLGCNENFAQAVGLTNPDQIIGKTDYDLLWSRAEADAHRADDQEVIHQNLPKRHIIEPVRTADGKSIWADTARIPLLDAAGKPYGVLGVYDDITERKQTEEALRESEAALKKAQEVSHVGSWAWHIQQNRLEWSDEMYHIFGIDKKSFSGNLADVLTSAIHPDDRTAVEASNNSVVQDQKPIPLEYRVIWPDGTVRVVWAEAGELIPGPQGKPEVLTGIVQDITERKQAENKITEQLEELRRWHAVTLGREKRILELKSEVNRVLNEAGKPLRYASVQENEHE